MNNIKIYNDLNNESDIYSNSNNQDVKSNKLLLNIPHFEITVSSINKSLNESKIKFKKNKIENEDKLTEINDGIEGPNLYINPLENEKKEIPRNNILNLNNKILNNEPDSTSELKENEYFNSKIPKETFYKNEKTGLIEMIPEVGYIKNPILYDISEKPYSEKEKQKELKRKKSIKINEKKEEYDDNDLNEMELYNAIENDKRTFVQFYLFQLKEQQEIFDSFFKYEPFEPFIIKRMTFFFSISLYFTLNALFYNEDIISQKYNKKGKVNLIEFIKMEINIIVYSITVGMALLYLIKCFFSARRRLDSLIKREKDPEIFRKEAIKCVNRMKKEFIAFIIFTFCLEILFWYYLSCFCNVYKNTQIDWLKSSLITIFIIEILPFFLVLLITILRFVGMKFKLESLYKTSQCLADS